MKEAVMRTDWFPGRLDGKVAMAADWEGYLTTERAAAFGIPAAAITQLTTLRTTAAAKLAVTESAAKTPVAVEESRLAFKALEDFMRDMKRRYFLEPPLTDADLVGLGLKVPDRNPTPVPIPATRPMFVLRPGDSRQVIVEFKDEGSESKARPYGYSGAVIYYAVLSAPPADQTALTRSLLATRTPYTLEFTEEDRGKVVYIALRWQNGRGEKGPWTDIQSAYVP
jgi:hypothetical protein